MDFKDFKSSCRALITSEVGSIPTRSRQRLFRAAGATAGGPGHGGPALAAMALALAAALIAAGASRAEPAAAGTAAPAPATRSTASPVSTLLRSLACPGWGQLENGQPLKAVAVFGAEAGLLASGFVELRRAERSLEAQGRAADRGDAAEAAEEYQRYLDRRDRGISRFWWAGFAILLSMLDAYTDAHLRDFDTGSEFPPPAETPEDAPAAPASGAGQPPAAPAPDEEGAGSLHSPDAALVVDVSARRVGIAFTF